MLEKLTQEKLGELLRGFMGKQVTWHNTRGWYVQIKLPIAGPKGMKVLKREERGDRVVLTLTSEGGNAATATLIVNFILNDMDNGKHQQLEMVGFTPWEPNQLKAKEWQFPEAIKLCSDVSAQEASAHIVPQVNLSVDGKTGWFFAKKGIEDPGCLPGEWLVNHWLKPGFEAIILAFTRIGLKFSSAA